MLSIISSVTNLFSTVVERIWPDATESEKAKLALLSQELSQEFKLLEGQLEVNKLEAVHENIFVAGWRPFIGWVCGIALLYASLLEPTLRFIAKVAFEYEGDFPIVNTEITLQVLMGLLGLGGLRTFEKYKSVSHIHK